MSTGDNSETADLEWHMNRTSTDLITDMDDPELSDPYGSVNNVASFLAQPPLTPLAPTQTCPILSPVSLQQGKVVEVDYKAIASQAKELVLWRKPIHSAVVFGSLLTVEIVLMSMSFLSIVGYTGLGLLLALIGFRTFLKFSGKTDSYGILDKLDHKLELTSDDAEKSIKSFILKVESILESMRELLLLKNVANSIKFGLGLYMLTYIGARFNFLTLCLLSTICVFVLPKVYELKKAEIDQLWELGKEKVKELNSLVMAKLSTLPIPGFAAMKEKDQ